LKALDEGLADFHGYATTCGGTSTSLCHPNFLAVSVDQAGSDARDLSHTDRCMTQTLRDAMNNFTQSQWLNQGLQYQLGTIIASSLYQAVNKTSSNKLGVMSKALVNAYSDATPTSEGLNQIINRNLQTPEKFTLEAVADSILSHITDPELAKATCGEMLDRLQLDRTQMVACPVAATKGTSCPVLP
jgi:hypothetical protein